MTSDNKTLHCVSNDPEILIHAWFMLPPDNWNFWCCFGWNFVWRNVTKWRFPMKPGRDKALLILIKAHFLIALGFWPLEDVGMKLLYAIEQCGSKNMEKRTGKRDLGSPHWQRGRKPGANGQDYPFLGTGTGSYVHTYPLYNCWRFRCVSWFKLNNG